jgi:hypothetical protein
MPDRTGSSGSEILSITLGLAFRERRYRKSMRRAPFGQEASLRFYSALISRDTKKRGDPAQIQKGFSEEGTSKATAALRPNASKAGSGQIWLALIEGFPRNRTSEGRAV